MAEIPQQSSHQPWAPLPRLVDWDDVGDGSVFTGMPGAGVSPEVMLRDRDRARTAYRQSIEYSLNTLVSYVETYGDGNLVLVFLGDHQPAPTVTGEGASRDVRSRSSPVTTPFWTGPGWGWHEGLKPGEQAPVWMDACDRFLTAFDRSRTRPVVAVWPVRRMTGTGERRVVVSRPSRGARSRAGDRTCC
jgi:hypothetical protein